MALLRDSVVQGSLRVTDTTYTTNLNISSATASLIVKTDANKNLISGALTASEIPNLSANKITSDTLSADRIPNLAAGKITSGTFGAARIPILSIIDKTSGTLTVARGGTYLTSITLGGIIYAASTSAYGCTSAGTTNQILVSGGTGAPTWKPTANGAAYATSTNGALTFGLLPVALGGTGISTIDPHKVLIGPATGTTAAAPTWRLILNNEIAPIASKIYNAKVYGADGLGTCFYQNFMTVTPVDYNAIWTVTYRVIVTAEGHSDYTAIYDEKISGRSNTYYSWYSYNSLVSYPIYLHMLLNSPNINTPHEIGIRMASSYGDTTVAKKILVDLLETYNCTVVLLDNLKYYTSATPSGCVWRTWNATSNGMLESGDSNDTGYYILSNGFKGEAGSNKVYRYCLFARTGDGTYESFVMQDNDRGTTKTANPHGFVPDGKIYWNSGNATYSAGTLNISAYQLYHALDYLYSFNFSNTFLPDYCETYVVYTYNPNDGLLYLDTTLWFAGGLPTTEDGKIYQRIGSKYYTGTTNYYQGSLLLENPYYEYKNGKILTWHPLRPVENSSTALYPVGVTGTATNILRHNTAITMTGGAISAASLSLTGTLGVSGATTLSSTLNLNGIFKSNSSNYGAALPETGNSEGRIFFQTAAIEYELPAGGIEGSFLIKATDDDRDVIWGDTVKRLTSLEGIAIVSGGLLITNGGVVARNSTIEAYRVYNAVWNDYAECRQSKEIEPGRVITETYGGIMELASLRLMPACKVISDTYGALMGESNLAKTPIAVAGRVLVYPYKNRESYNLGDAVCSAPGGTVDIMSREEIRDYPERIIGTVSEIPTYDTWYAGDKDNPTSVSVNGRIWIYVR